jgi:hypothetical protein
MARDVAVQAGINHLAVAIEVYRDEHDKYSASLKELLSGSKPEMKDSIRLCPGRAAEDQGADQAQHERESVSALADTFAVFMPELLSLSKPPRLR